MGKYEGAKVGRRRGVKVGKLECMKVEVQCSKLDVRCWKFSSPIRFIRIHS